MLNRWKLALVALLLPGLVLAQLAIQEKGYNVWLIEKPYIGQAYFVARIAGVASYQRFQANATLAFSCRADGSGRVSTELAVDPKPLGFDSDPYEGPDATFHGPVSIDCQRRPSGDHASSCRLFRSGWAI
jgi:hypothetical protein